MKRGDSSDTPKQHSILLRVDPQFHRQIRQASAILGKSMNTFIIESVEQSISIHAKQGTFTEQIHALQTKDPEREASENS